MWRPYSGDPNTAAVVPGSRLCLPTCLTWLHHHVAAQLAFIRLTNYSDNWSLIVQRPCEMPKRSPVIFWLLLAATLCVDAVAFFWATWNPYSAFGVVLFDALMLSQVSVICIWAGLHSKKNIWIQVAPLSGVLIASLAVRMTTDESLTIGLAYYGLHTGMILATLWLLERTRFWQRRSGAVAHWRYSIAQMLIVMTAIALLSTFVRTSELFAGDAWLNIVFICSSLALALVAVVSWSLSWHWLIRLAVVLAFAIILGAAFSLKHEAYVPLFPLIIGGHYLIQGLVLSLWLGCGPILPLTSHSSVAPIS